MDLPEYVPISNHPELGVDEHGSYHATPRTHPLVQPGPGQRGDGYPNAPEGKWSSGLFDCFSPLGICCMATFCRCIPLGQVVQRSRLLKNGFNIVLGLTLVIVITTPFNSTIRELLVRPLGENVDCGFTVIFLRVISGIRFLCGLVLFIIFVLVRRRVAKIYQIPNNILGNCCAVMWCSCCALIQMAKHLFNWHRGVNIGCEWSPEPRSYWPDQPISPNEMESRRELDNDAQYSTTATRPAVQEP